MEPELTTPTRRNPVLKAATSRRTGIASIILAIAAAALSSAATTLYWFDHPDSIVIPMAVSTATCYVAAAACYRHARNRAAQQPAPVLPTNQVPMQRNAVTATILEAAATRTGIAAIVLIITATALACASAAVYEHHRPDTLLLALASGSAAAYVAAFACSIHASIRGAQRTRRQPKTGA